MIKWTYAYFVDNDREIIELREGHTDYTHYIEFLLACINTSKKLSKYNITSNDTEVVSCVIKSVKAQFEANDEEKAIILRNCETIANRFLRKEIEVKKDVKQLPVEVRSGCLIIAYIITNKVNQYLI